MDYAELGKKFRYTDMSKNVNGYTYSDDPIGSEEDMNAYWRNMVSDMRPDVPTIEYDIPTPSVDSVATLRLHYSGIRYGQDSRDYQGELFLEDTTKDPRRSFTDPKFNEAVKQTYGRMQFLTRNLYPEDPGTGSITSGTVSQYGIDIQKLQGRALSESRYKQRLVDSLDGTEPRREYRFDTYSWVDKALANQGDLPYVMNTRETGFVNNNGRSVTINDKTPWAQGEVDFKVAKIGRNGPHYSAADRKRMANSQVHKADSREKSRFQVSSDETQQRSAAMQQMALETLRQVIEDIKRDEAAYGKTGSNRDKMEWGQITENIRSALDKQFAQKQMNAGADDIMQSQRGLGRSETKNAGIHNIVNSKLDTSMLAAVYRDLINNMTKPSAEIKSATEISQLIKPEIDKINQNWRVEWAAEIAKSRDAGDNFTEIQYATDQTRPWYETRALQVSNIGRRSTSRNDATRILQDAQKANFVAINDSGNLYQRGLTNADKVNPGSVVYSANQGTAFHLDMAARAGSMGGVAAPLTTKQKVRFDVAESSDGILDVNDIDG